MKAIVQKWTFQSARTGGPEAVSEGLGGRSEARRLGPVGAGGATQAGW